MPRIPLSRAQPGQKLLKPVTTAAGVVMVQAGTELSAPLIERLSGLGVETLVVAPEPAAGEAASGALEDRARQVEARFSGHEHDPRMMALKALVIRQLSQGKGDDA